MTTNNSRQLLNAIRSFAETKLTAEGATEDLPNVGVPFNNDQRVRAAIAWVNQREAEVLALWTQPMEDAWATVQDEVWVGLNAALDAAGVRQFFDDVWNDPDANARILLRGITRLLSELVCYHRYK